MFRTKLPRFSSKLSHRPPSIRLTLAPTSLATRPVSTRPAPRLILPPPLRPFSAVPPTGINKEHERAVAQEKVDGPHAVSSTSTVRPVIETRPGETKSAAEDEESLTRGIKSDLHAVSDTFSLAAVPREPFALGLAGTLPYLATSLSTVFLSWNLHSVAPHWLAFSPDAAAHWLRLLEPVQLGYGAVIISFLGAVHWGLEYAADRPDPTRTRFRYGLGTLAPALAWPTLLLPVEWALTAQFAAFVALYAADARAAARGWVPAWYPTYRFVLTAVVGVALGVSLVSRTRSTSESGGVPTHRLREAMDKPARNAEPYAKWAELEKKEKEKARVEQDKKDKAEEKNDEGEKAKEETKGEKAAEKEAE